MSKPFISIPTWSPDLQWTYTDFSTREELRDFVKKLFKEPGKYEFDETTAKWNEHAITWKNKKMFCEAPEGSRDYLEFWDTEKEKCRKGVIYHNGKGGTWYVTRYLYFWWNFLQISDKLKSTQDFPEVWDVHYHISLYNTLAELYYKHSAILKKRQIGSSLYHMAEMINILWFEKSLILKLGASLKDYVNNDKGSWLILEGYRNFLNMETGWYRPMNPDKSAQMSWQQRQEMKGDGKSFFIGNNTKITGTSFDKSPVAGVGGPCKRFFYEEAGITKDMHVTFEYMLPALNMGDITTGLFIAAGSVGELDKCQPLKEMLLNPSAKGIYAVETNLLDEAGTVGRTGLFIPEQWAMPPYIDKYGNSLVEDALKAIEQERILWERGGIDSTGERCEPLPPEERQLRISQKPRNIAEAFAIRKISPFPAKYTAPQIKRIEDKTYHMKYVDLERGEDEKIYATPSDRIPLEYPINKNAEDKRACVVIYEDPIPNAPFRTYVANIDPVETDATVSSDSVAAIYIWKMAVEVETIDAEGNKIVTVEGGKIVASYAGRYNDVNETNEYLSRLVEYYNAYTMCERNKPGWLAYMREKKRYSYLAKGTDMVLDKEQNYNNTDESAKVYGYNKTVQLGSVLKRNAIESLGEELNKEYKEDGTLKRIVYGVERIPDIWLLKEMQQFEDKKNFDRIDAYSGLITFVKSLKASGLTPRKIERKQHNPQELQQLHNLLNNRSPFRNLGKSQNMSNPQYTMPRKAFKNLR